MQKNPEIGLNKGSFLVKYDYTRPRPVTWKEPTGKFLYRKVISGYNSICVAQWTRWTRPAIWERQPTMKDVQQLMGTSP